MTDGQLVITDSMTRVQGNGSHSERNSARLPRAASGDTQFKTHTLLTSRIYQPQVTEGIRSSPWMGQENSSPRFNDFRSLCEHCPSRLSTGAEVPTRLRMLSGAAGRRLPGSLTLQGNRILYACVTSLSCCLPQRITLSVCHTESFCCERLTSV